MRQAMDPIAELVPGITLKASPPWNLVTLMTVDSNGSVSLDVSACDNHIHTHD